MSNQMYIVDLREKVSEAETPSDILDMTEGIWKAIHKRMRDIETLWIVSTNDYHNGRFIPVSMSVAEAVKEEADFILKNTITVHQWGDCGGDMNSAYDEIHFFVRDKREYQFNKDEIRIEHVYKGNEWGGERLKGNSSYHDTKVKRYNPNGKDPGNVWLDEDRTQTNDQKLNEVTELSFSEAIRRCIIAGSEVDETVNHLWTDDSVARIIADESRTSEQLQVSRLRNELTQL